MMQNQREPFFKPLNVESGNYEMSMKTQKSRQNQMANEKVKQLENLDVSDEKLTVLHVKLHQEADKIRKWKNQTEYDLKQKDQKIQESTQTIDSLRKSILDLQLQNESLSLTLQEEIANQQEIVQSVNATRNICAVLKDHMARADAKITDCEAEKTELRYLEKEHKQQFEDLSNKFKALEQNKKEEQSKLEKEFSVLKEDNTKVVEDLQIQIKNAEQELIILQGKCDDKDIEIRDIRKEVQKNQESIHTYEKTVDMLKENLKTKEEEVAVLKEQYETSCQMCETVESNKCATEEKLRVKESEIECLENKYSALQIDHEASKESHTQEQLTTQKKLEESRLHIEQKEERIRNLENDLDKTNSVLEEVKCSKDVLIMERTAIESRLQEFEALNAQLSNQHEQNCQTISQMSSTINNLQAQLSASQEEGAVLRMQLNEAHVRLSSMESEKLELGERIKVFESEMTTKQSSLSELQKELHEKCELIQKQEQELQSIQKCLQSEQEIHEQTKARLDETEDKFTGAIEEIKSMNKEIKALQKEIDTLSKQNKTLSKSLQKSETEEQKLREEISELQSELALQKEANESLLEERQKQDETMQGQLQSKDKTTSDLESKNKTLKSDNTAKNKQIKELEKEAKSLKTKITTITKAVDGKEEQLDKLQSRFETEVSEKEKITQELHKTEKLMQKAKKDSELAQKENNAMKEMADKCIAEKDVMIQQCEQMRTEMSNIMQNYKSENDRLVVKKDQEINELKTEMAKGNKMAMKKAEEEIKTLKTENEKLRNTLSQSGYAMENLQKTYGLKENEVMELKKENFEKNEELKDLQQQLEKMVIKNNTKTTTSVVQTSPFPDKTYQHTKNNPATPKVSPRTPLMNPVGPSGDSIRTPMLKLTPRTPRTPTGDLKTPQRSILKTLTMNSASKKRRVVFATRNEDEGSVSSESSTFEVMETTDENDKRGLGTPLLIKPSPKVQSSYRTTQDSLSVTPVARTPRRPIGLDKKKSKGGQDNGNENTDMHCSDDMQRLISEEKSKKKEKPSSVRKAPKKEGGKFFKTSPKTKLGKFREKEGMSWFESDDIFGFGTED